MAAEKNEVLERLGITEAQLQAAMARARQRRTFIVEVPWAVYGKWEEILHLTRWGEIDKDEAEARFESEVFPHLAMRPGIDYDPRHDIIDIVPQRRVSTIHRPA